MSRLLTQVAEVIANVEPRELFDWFGCFGMPDELKREKDRCLLFLGFDASRSENTVEGMLKWSDDFKRKACDVQCGRLGATVFVLDWPAALDGESKLTDDDIDRLMDAGICYRPKDRKFYEECARQFKECLRRDLLENHLIPEESEEAAVAPRSAPDAVKPEVREATEFLGSSQFVWPPEAVRELFHR